MAKKKWNELSDADRRASLLSAIRRGRSIKSLADYLDAPPHAVEAMLMSELELGVVRCSNKVWYRTDVELRPEPPRRPRLTVKQELFLKRQGNLF